MCGQDSMYSTTTNPSYIPSSSNQVNAMSNSIVAGSGFLTDRQVYFNCIVMGVSELFLLGM